MSAMQQSEKLARKRLAATDTGVLKRRKGGTEERPSLMQLLPRKSVLQSRLPLVQTLEVSDEPLTRLAPQQKIKRATECKAKMQYRQQQMNTWGETTEQGDVVFELSAKRQVTVRKWKAMKFVDIREYYDDNGKAKPGKKGQ